MVFFFRMGQLKEWSDLWPENHFRGQFFYFYGHKKRSKRNLDKHHILVIVMWYEIYDTVVKRLAHM